MGVLKKRSRKVDIISCIKKHRGALSWACVELSSEDSYEEESVNGWKIEFPQYSISVVGYVTKQIVTDLIGLIEDAMTRYAITRGMIDLYKDLHNITDELP